MWYRMTRKAIFDKLKGLTMTGVIVVSILWMVSPCPAVEGLSVSSVLGYSCGFGDRPVGNDWEENSDGAVIKCVPLYYNAGQGAKFRFGLRYHRLPVIDIGLDIRYSMGSNSLQYKSKDLVDPADPSWIIESCTMRTFLLSFIPTVRAPVRMTGFGLICALGISITPFPGSVRYHTSEYRKEGTGEVLASMQGGETRIAYYPAIGGVGVLGVRFSLSSRWGLVCVINAEQLSLTPKRREVTKQQYNGEDISCDISTRAKKTDYEKDNINNDHENDSKLCVESTVVTPASSVALSIGISYIFP